MRTSRLRTVATAVLVGIVACTASEPRESGVAPAEPPAAPTEVAPVVAAPPAKVEHVPAPPPIPDPAALPLPVDPSPEERIAEALETDDAAVVVVATKPIAKDLLVLYAIYGGDEESTYAWAVARVHVEPTRIDVVARTLLWGPASDDLDPETATVVFKAYDMDRDKRSELTVVVPVAFPQDPDENSESEAEIAAILDVSDLHVQFAATRRMNKQWGDVFGALETAETVWVAKDADGDGRADLKLTHRASAQDTSACDVECDDAEPPAATRERTSQLCPYDIASDRWTCPAPQVGKEALAGNDGVRPIESAPTPAAAELPSLQ
jgi:hypothetical protein